MKTHNSMKILVLFGLVFSQLGFANKDKPPLSDAVRQFQFLFPNREDYPSVVKIYSEFSSGTAFFISPELVVTNFHVIDSIDKTLFIETVNEEEIPIKSIVALDGINDLAILQVKDYQSEDYYELRFNNKPISFIHTMGFPNGNFRYERGNINIWKKTSDSIYTTANILRMISGASGSPVFSSSTGELVGVLRSSTGYSAGLVLSEKLKELLSKGSLNCDFSICISEEIGRIKDLAEKGHREAVKYMDFIKDRGVEQNDEDGHSALFQKIKEALISLHITPAMEQNYKEAFKWAEKAALQEHKRAQFELALMYFEGVGVTVEQNYEEAFKWLEKAALQGYIRAQFELALMYFEGIGVTVEQNYEEAFKWLEKAALQGYTRAQFYLAALYFGGLGVEQNYEEAFKWLEKAALQGHKRAQFYFDKFKNR